MVLAFGAQIEGGDGDAQCHKDVARAWSEVLKKKAKEIMLEHGQGKGGVDLVNLWVIMAAFSRSYGSSDGESRITRIDEDDPSDTATRSHRQY